MSSPFEDIAFLAASRNRVTVLEALADQPHDRHGLQTRLDISQPTASRILRDLREHEWVTRNGNRYELTPVGEFVIAAFTDLQEQFETIHHLRDVIPLLPDQDYDFDLRRFRSADVVRFAAGSTGKTLSHEVAQYHAADRVQIVTDSAPREGVEAVWNQVTEEGQHLNVVLTRGAVTSIRGDPDLARWTREMLASGRARVHQYDGDLPAPIIITDDTVNLALPSDEEESGGWITTTDQEVLAWAEETFEEYRDQAVPLTADDFSE